MMQQMIRAVVPCTSIHEFYIQCIETWLLRTRKKDLFNHYEREIMSQMNR